MSMVIASRKPPPSRMASPSHPMAAALVSEAMTRGFNLIGFVGAQQFDACQPPGRRASDVLPDCGTIFLLGSGGSGFWSHLLAQGPPIPAPAPKTKQTGFIACSSINFFFAGPSDAGI